MAKVDWSSTPRCRRKRGELSVTISDEARRLLDEMAPAGTRSEFVERLILDEAEKRQLRRVG